MNKKSRSYTWAAILFVLAMAAIPSVLPTILKANTNKGSRLDWLCRATINCPGGEPDHGCRCMNQVVIPSLYCAQHGGNGPVPPPSKGN
jgi:hypothetical protein